VSAVQTLAARIRAVTGGPVEWWNTGGGCMVLRVATADGGEVYISDREGPLSHPDYESDEHVEGFAAGYYPPGYGETHDEARELWIGPAREGGPEEPDDGDAATFEAWEAQDAAHRTAWLADQAAECAAAVLAFLPTVRPEPRAGMVGKYVAAVVSHDLPGGMVETTVHLSGGGAWTFTEPAAPQAGAVQ
jgi:hypothetical protein